MEKRSFSRWLETASVNGLPTVLVYLIIFLGVPVLRPFSLFAYTSSLLAAYLGVQHLPRWGLRPDRGQLRITTDSLTLSLLVLFLALAMPILESAVGLTARQVAPVLQPLAHVIFIVAAFAAILSGALTCAIMAFGIAHGLEGERTPEHITARTRHELVEQWKKTWRK